LQHFKRKKYKGRGSKSGGRHGMGGVKFGGGGFGKFGKGKGGGGKNKCFVCGKSGHWAQQVFPSVCFVSLSKGKKGSQKLSKLSLSPYSRRSICF
jgi:hypothetical protein